jgi:hypothetical protein
MMTVAMRYCSPIISAALALVACSALVFGFVAPLVARQTAQHDMTSARAVVRDYMAQLPPGKPPDLNELQFRLERRIALSNTKENWIQAGRAALTLVLPCAVGAYIIGRLAKRTGPLKS